GNDEKPSSAATVEVPVKEKAPTPPKELAAKASPTTSKVNSISGLAAGEEVIIAPDAITKSKTEELPKKVGPGKYVIQVGAFASEERAKGWIAKMKDQKIPNYVLNKNGADGVKLYLLRAGPFTDKDTAEAAEKKVKAMGLSPRLVEVEAP
ncbi:MAG: SPOR domain-containing protein, partial [Rhodoferax sp.]|nr:SPOR domain-containing protein [Rhodoferax sp.]